MSAAGGFKWSRLRGDADAEETWQWRKWVIVGGGVFALSMVGFLVWALANSGQEEVRDPVRKAPEPKQDMSWLSSSGPQYQKHEPPQIQPVEQMPQRQQADNPYRQQAQPYSPPPAPKPVSQAIMKARGSQFGEYVPDENSRFATSVSGGAPCSASAGTAIMAEIDTAVNTDHLGTVRAIVTNDVSGYDGCTAIPAGAVLVGTPNGAARRSADRVDIDFATLVVNGRSVSLESAVASDSMGRGGMPASRDSHFWSRAGAIAVATAVDLGRVSLASQGGAYGAVIFQQSGSVIDRWANEILDRPTTLTVDPTAHRLPITIILTQDITL